MGAECQGDGRTEQERVYSMRHDFDPALPHDRRTAELPDAAQQEQREGG